MADIAASVLARLKNKAAESGRSYQLCLQVVWKNPNMHKILSLKAVCLYTPLPILTAE